MIAGIGTIIIFMMLFFGAILFFTATIITRYKLWKKVIYGVIISIIIVIVGSVLQDKLQIRDIERNITKNSAKFPEPNIEKDFDEVIDAANKKMKEIQVDALKMIGVTSYFNETETTKQKLRADEYFFINHKNEFIVTKRIGNQQSSAVGSNTMPARSDFVNYIVLYTYKGWIGREVTIWDKVLMVKNKNGQIVRDIGYINKDSESWYEAEGVQRDLYFTSLVDCPINLIAGCEEIHYTKFKEDVNLKRFFKNNNERILYRENLDTSKHPIAIAYRESKDKHKFFYQEKNMIRFTESGSKKDSLGKNILSLED